MSGKNNPSEQLNDGLSKIVGDKEQANQACGDNERDAYDKEIERFCGETQMLSSDSEMFLTDSDGELLFSNNLSFSRQNAEGDGTAAKVSFDGLYEEMAKGDLLCEKAQEEKTSSKKDFFLGALSYIDRSQREKYLENRMASKAQIYTCDPFGAEYITVGVGYGASVKCVKLNLTENTCEKLEDYRIKLENTAKYIKSFSKSQNVTLENQPVVDKINYNRRAVDELLNFAETEKQEEPSKIDVGEFIGAICKVMRENISSVTSDGTFEEKSFVSYVGMSCSRAILYMLGFMVKNSKNKDISVKTKLFKNRIKVIFSTDLFYSRHYDLYSDTMTRILGRLKVEGKMLDSGKRLTLEITFPLYDETVTVQESDGTRSLLIRQLCDKRTVDTLRFVSGE